MKMKMELGGKNPRKLIFSNPRWIPKTKGCSVSVPLNFKQILGETKKCGFKNVYLLQVAKSVQGIYDNMYTVYLYHITLHCIASNSITIG